VTTKPTSNMSITILANDFSNFKGVTLSNQELIKDGPLPESSALSSDKNRVPRGGVGGSRNFRSVKRETGEQYYSLKISSDNSQEQDFVDLFMPTRIVNVVIRNLEISGLFFQCNNQEWDLRTGIMKGSCSDQGAGKETMECQETSATAWFCQWETAIGGGSREFREAVVASGGK